MLQELPVNGAGDPLPGRSPPTGTRPTATCFSSRTRPSGAPAAPATNQRTAHYVPADKQYDSQRIAGLYEKGERKAYAGRELTHIAMPCGGVGAGELNIRGDGQREPIKLTESERTNLCKRFTLTINALPQPSVGPVKAGHRNCG